jgi:hypothetical protein
MLSREDFEELLQCEHWEKDDEGGCEEDREMGQQ